MLMKSLGSRLRGAGDLPAVALRGPQGERVLSGGASPSAGRTGSLSQELGGGLNESGVLEELDEHLVDELVLGDGLDHEHPLLPEEPQHYGHLHLL